MSKKSTKKASKAMRKQWKKFAKRNPMPTIRTAQAFIDIPMPSLDGLGIGKSSMIEPRPYAGMSSREVYEVLGGDETQRAEPETRRFVHELLQQPVHVGVPLHATKPMNEDQLVAGVIHHAMRDLPVSTYNMAQINFIGWHEKMHQWFADTQAFADYCKLPVEEVRTLFPAPVNHPYEDHNQ